MKINKLNLYLKETNIHITKLENVLKRLKEIYPLNLSKFETLNYSEKDMLDTLSFRFAKLQDLIGSKIF